MNRPAQSEQEKQSVREWISAALADGWDSEATYGAHEDESRARTMEREGFKAMILTRDDQRFVINIWGPDGLAITPAAYSWEALQAGLRTCGECGKADVDTKRVGFAGRCCSECMPAARAKYEFRGWCD